MSPTSFAFRLTCVIMLVFLTMNKISEARDIGYKQDEPFHGGRFDEDDVSAYMDYLIELKYQQSLQDRENELTRAYKRSLQRPLGGGSSYDEDESSMEDDTMVRGDMGRSSVLTKPIQHRDSKADNTDVIRLMRYALNTLRNSRHFGGSFQNPSKRQPPKGFNPVRGRRGAR